jgi:hypothetical protein
LHLGRLDDEMYEDFQATFPEFAESADPKSVLKVDEEAMKSPAGKEKWRVFINKYENKGEHLHRTGLNGSSFPPRVTGSLAFLSLPATCTISQDSRLTLFLSVSLRFHQSPTTTLVP